MPEKEVGAAACHRGPSCKWRRSTKWSAANPQLFAICAAVVAAVCSGVQVSSHQEDALQRVGEPPRTGQLAFKALPEYGMPGNIGVGNIAAANRLDDVGKSSGPASARRARLQIGGLAEQGIVSPSEDHAAEQDALSEEEQAWIGTKGLAGHLGSSSTRRESWPADLDSIAKRWEGQLDQPGGGRSDSAAPGQPSSLSQQAARASTRSFHGASSQVREEQKQLLTQGRQPVPDAADSIPLQQMIPPEPALLPLPLGRESPTLPPLPPQAEATPPQPAELDVKAQLKKKEAAKMVADAETEGGGSAQDKAVKAIEAEAAAERAEEDAEVARDDAQAAKAERTPADTKADRADGAAKAPPGSETPQQAGGGTSIWKLVFFAVVAAVVTIVIMTSSEDGMAAQPPTAEESPPQAVARMLVRLRIAGMADEQSWSAFVAVCPDEQPEPKTAVASEPVQAAPGQDGLGNPDAATAANPDAATADGVAAADAPSPSTGEAAPAEATTAGDATAAEAAPAEPPADAAADPAPADAAPEEAAAEPPQADASAAGG
eukprot:TRINITY_DN43695_c0_g1_i1.p1 TRINITY_DN43695_c0_g1~~TRINITY_DN43695_c0_g1_i1.p1  ORF type:complete len:547 (-),score=130.24 TRINITY_DN43695_c0_g1_i1:76-1716(-)